MLSGVRSRDACLTVRLVFLHAGLVAFGVSLALLVKARAGLDPWDVLNQGIARRLGIQIGWVVDAVGAVVLAAWIPLRQRPGFGTVSNVVVIGLVVNAALDLLPDPHGLVPRAGVLAAAIVLNGAATGCYIGAGLGPGPRDGLDDGPCRPRSFPPGSPHRHRAIRVGVGVRPRWLGRRRDRRIRPRDRAPRTCLAPASHLDHCAPEPPTSKGAECNPCYSG